MPPETEESNEQRTASERGADATLNRLKTRLAPLRRVLAWLVALLLLAFSARVLLHNPEPLRQLSALPLLMWLGLAPLAVLNSLFVAWRMSLAVARAGGGKVPGGAWFRIVVLGQFLNLLVPQLGNVYRGATLKREFGVSYMAYASGLVTFIWLDTVFGFFSCLLLVGALAPGLRMGNVPALPAIAVALVVLIGAPIAATKLLASRPLEHKLIARIQQRASTLMHSVTRALREPRFLLSFMSVSALITADQMLVLWLCFRAVGMPIDVPTTALFQTIVKLSNQVVITPGNLGLTELAFGVLGAAAEGGSLEHGIAASLVFRTLFTIAVITMGILLGGLGLLRSLRRSPTYREAGDSDS